MSDIKDIWNTECTLTNNVLSKATIVDLGIGEQIFLVADKTAAGRSEHYYAQNPVPKITTQKDADGKTQQVRSHSLQSVFHQAECQPPQGANAKTSLLQGANGEQGQKIKEQVGWSH